jgi:hypothetical protein
MTTALQASIRTASAPSDSLDLAWATGSSPRSVQWNEKQRDGLAENAQARNARQYQTAQVPPLSLPEVKDSAANRQQQKPASEYRRKQIPESETAPTVVVNNDAEPEQTDQ